MNKILAPYIELFPNLTFEFSPERVGGYFNDNDVDDTVENTVESSLSIEVDGDQYAELIDKIAVVYNFNPEDFNISNIRYISFEDNDMNSDPIQDNDANSDSDRDYTLQIFASGNNVLGGDLSILTPYAQRINGITGIKMSKDSIIFYPSDDNMLTGDFSHLNPELTEGKYERVAIINDTKVSVVDIRGGRARYNLVSNNVKDFYSVKSGDTLFDIVRRHYGLVDNSQISKMVNYVVDQQPSSPMAMRLSEDVSPPGAPDGIKGDRLFVGDNLFLPRMPDTLDSISR